MKNRFKDFKKFVNKGNILDLATGIIIGAAFTAIVNSLVNDIVMPCISNLIKVDLTNLKYTFIEAQLDAEGEVIKEAVTLNYGNFIQSVINFIIIAVAIYIAITTVRSIKNGYIKSEIRYIKKLKIKHPEFFDEEDELGTKLYEKLKKEHPEHFKNEIALEIEEKKKEADKEISPQEQTNILLQKLNDNLEKVYNLKSSDETIEETESK